MSQYLIKHAENLRAKQWPEFKWVFFRHRNNNFVAAKSSNNENTVKRTAFWLSAWKKVVIRGGNCQGNRKLGADPA